MLRTPLSPYGHPHTCAATGCCRAVPWPWRGCAAAARVRQQSPQTLRHSRRCRLADRATVQIRLKHSLYYGLDSPNLAPRTASTLESDYTVAEHEGVVVCRPTLFLTMKARLHF